MENTTTMTLDDQIINKYVMIGKTNVHKKERLKELMVLLQQKENEFPDSQKIYKNPFHVINSMKKRKWKLNDREQDEIKSFMLDFHHIKEGGSDIRYCETSEIEVIDQLMRSLR